MAIHHLTRLVCVCLVAAPLVSGDADVFAVWAIGDSVRIDPIRSQAFEDNQKLFPDGIRAGYKESNLIWDARSRRVSLRAARNETIAFQIVIERTTEKLSHVKVGLGDL